MAPLYQPGPRPGRAPGGSSRRIRLRRPPAQPTPGRAPESRTGGSRRLPPVYLVHMVPDPWVRVAGNTAPRLAPATGAAYSLIRGDAPAVVVRVVPKIGVQAKLVD